MIAGGAAAALAIARSLAAAEAAGGCAATLAMATRVRARSASSSGGPSARSRPSSTTSRTCSSMRSWHAAALGRRPGRRPRPGGRLAGAVAAAQALPAFRRSAEKNIQILGGIGFTWEHDAHLYLRRASALAALFDRGRGRRRGRDARRRRLGQRGYRAAARGRDVSASEARAFKRALRRAARTREQLGALDRLGLLHAALAASRGAVAPALSSSS